MESDDLVVGLERRELRVVKIKEDVMRRRFWRSKRRFLEVE